MQKPRIMMDTSSWINLYEIGLINHLMDNFQVFVTPKVRDEILEGKEFAEDVTVFEEATESKIIKVDTPKTTPEEIRHEISISSGEIEVIAYAIEKDFFVLIDDSRVYRVMDRFNLKYFSSANIVLDAYMGGRINKDRAYELLENLRRALKDEVVDRAKEELKWR